ncbi:(2Fe-2S) ferredoxin domain-containing protein [Vallitalea pronyensis]|uniref:(2Fe-2S) ferredoxin domain-containing protein n=1 Tax=Vallitalea pronyensis TaxID=1348613 RepID=A0A8J8MLZ0_9FIRM|nr:(2Fe-2S) ferredoxin domain-containing protein [Vallitalea pronyensis]QUI23708.1 (2Fe-2S) ferredoxin domain-containing protein [Vallitalea pronyensis]
MAKTKPKYHIFVCTSSRLTGENKGYCVQQQGKDMVAAFVEEMQDRDLDSEMMITNTGCLGLCSMGPIVMIYPQQIWYGKVTVDDVEEIMDALEEEEVVERLLI